MLKHDTLNKLVEGLSIITCLFFDYLGDFFLKNRKIGDFTPGFGPKKWSKSHRRTKYEPMLKRDTLNKFVEGLSIITCLFFDLFRRFFPEKP